MVNGTILALFCCVYGIKPWEIGGLTLIQFKALTDSLPFTIMLTAGSPELAEGAMKELEKAIKKADQPSDEELIRQARALGLKVPKNIGDN